MVAGTFVSFYTDVDRLVDFVTTAIRAIPGVVDCRLVTDSNAAAGTVVGDSSDGYVVHVGTAGTQFGLFALGLSDRAAFLPYAAVVHNLANSIAMRIENLAYQAELEQLVQKRTSELQRALREKEVLLREIHHRVKNNLNMVISMLNMQFEGLTDAAVQAAVEASIDRIHSTALVHEFLYKSDSLQRIDFQRFVQRIVDEMSRNYRMDRDFTVATDIADIPVSIDQAVPVSLIVTELLTNAFKYAFPDGDAHGHVDIRAAVHADKTVQLAVADNGVGLPDGFDIGRCDSLGMQLVGALVEQLHGAIDLQPERPGTHWSIVFPLAPG